VVATGFPVLGASVKRFGRSGSKVAALVTGGAGFIGSHLVEQLLALGHPVRVVDNLSTGSERNLAHLDGQIDFLRGDLRDADTCRAAVRGVEVVFHVAALPSVPRSLIAERAKHVAAGDAAALRSLTAAARVRPG
jgi:UDP-glucose 4-epimerase